MKLQTKKRFMRLLVGGLFVPSLLFGFLLRPLLQEMDIDLSFFQFSMELTGLLAFLMLVIAMTSLYFVEQWSEQDFVRNKKSKVLIQEEVKEDKVNEIGVKNNKLTEKEDSSRADINRIGEDILLLLNQFAKKIGLQTARLKGTLQVMEEDVGQHSQLQTYSRLLQHQLVEQERLWQDIYNGLIRNPSFSWTRLEQILQVLPREGLSANFIREKIWTDGEKVKLAFSHLARVEALHGIRCIDGDTQRPLQLTFIVFFENKTEKDASLEENLHYLLAYCIFYKLKLLVKKSYQDEDKSLLWTLEFPLQEEYLSSSEKGGCRGVSNPIDHC
ncbi:hypothetical protein [Heliorestis convoluta]|uniref:Uncharacterized protein n=1 Tax=Heliorestis convoluta TaxID=356322 RepID=A0A5Q2N603_9FIRM|nr:hypothetical protein [Heliorestis convoluta]QGG49309.1 hypothetical protein FTV88_3243 [Heliorestis convoluta]